MSEWTLPYYRSLESPREEELDTEAATESDQRQGKWISKQQ